ncbi:MAG: hypothetical protein GX629_11795 [Phycisphaerae bacterium]|nr:hypothetical protein [Phycisphaerae bacterium]
MSLKIFLADFASANKTSYIKRVFLTILLIAGGVVYFEYKDCFSQKVSAGPTIETLTKTSTQAARNRREDKKLIETIPGDTVLAYLSFAEGGISDETGRMMTTLLTTASMAGLFSANQQILADVVSAGMTLSKYPHGVFLLDTRAKKLDVGSFTLESMQMGVVVRADRKDHGTFLSFIKQTLDHYFTADDAKLSWIGEGESRHQKLESPKFPVWCCWEWGSVDDTFIFTVGPGAYEKVFRTVRTRSDTLGEAVLMQLADEDDEDIERRMFFAYGDFEMLGDQLRPVMGNFYDKILESFAAGDVDRALLSAGFTGRAFISKIFLDRMGLYQRGYLTGDFPKGDWRARAVPPDATSYGVSYSEIPTAIRYAVDTYLASRNPEKREKLSRNYQKIAEEAGVGDVMEDVFSHMGPMVIIHDWPKHPLNLPIGKTMLVETDGSPGLKVRFDKAMQTWRTMLNALNGNDKDPPKDEIRVKESSVWESMFNLQLDRTPDGVWFVHIGPVVLLAGGMSDHFLVLSYAVPAVQANLNFLKNELKDFNKKVTP